MGDRRSATRAARAHRQVVMTPRSAVGGQKEEAPVGCQGFFHALKGDYDGRETTITTPIYHLDGGLAT